jgi:GNAT superfamily N-acetyltransferase
VGGIEYRVVPADDREGRSAVLAVRNAVRSDDPWTLATLDLIDAEVAWSVDVIAVEDGQAVGWGSTAPHAYRPDSEDAWSDLCVLEPARGRGIGGTLLERIRAAAGEHGKRAIRLEVVEDDAASRRFLERRDFVVVTRSQAFELDVAAADLPPADPPPGVRLTTLAAEPGLAKSVYRVAREASADVPGATGELAPFETWRALELDGPESVGAGQHVAVAGDEAVGYAIVLYSESEPGVGWHQMTGTARAWRGKGVASAVKRAAALAARDAGLHVLRTSNEERNAAMLAINRRLGYRPLPARLGMRGPA